MKKYYVTLTVEIEARDDSEADDQAGRISEDIFATVYGVDGCVIDSVDEA